jgi:hypothetical protein
MIRRISSLLLRVVDDSRWNELFTGTSLLLLAGTCRAPFTFDRLHQWYARARRSGNVQTIKAPTQRLALQHLLTLAQYREYFTDARSFEADQGTAPASASLGLPMCFNNSPFAALVPTPQAKNGKGNNTSTQRSLRLMSNPPPAMGCTRCVAA